MNNEQKTVNHLFANLARLPGTAGVLPALQPLRRFTTGALPFLDYADQTTEAAQPDFGITVREGARSPGLVDPAWKHRRNPSREGGQRV
jgi:hypothetical protein